ncbi:peptidoglycan bridge formation glycyltransferase FemA/FemB family protein [bacterium]|uniref:N-acetyltransferase domain-containing protein n=2 Tax=Katanobacteria TaxID=422282 RepID=A0A2M7X3S4_UNCKA|nr:peptidoglycan bridge formation glycyltransferase FemA/FemB family protein [bacterium]PIP56393.1 MAG: hypothetical protein COX05_03240 [candidate division WWE3 bacterium CG22_combo_CG10-13_8_21_14_all_39_12]PJA40797.1 MAG: hypothetical protein CO179_01395 [candidate division WWE3 bacterium CG_4_9_14_3_um_filter_39_7]
MLTVHDVTNKNEWRALVCSHNPQSMLQAWNWGDFEESQGHTVLRLGLYDDDQLVGANLCVVVKSRRANYIVSHAGPTIDWEDKAQFNAFHTHILEYAQKENLDFMRFRAPLIHDDQKIKEYISMGYRKAPMYFNAEYTMTLDLTQSEDELLSSMRKNTRYYVRKAQKQGVTVRISTDVSDLCKLFDVYNETVKRQGFVSYDKQFFIDEFEAFNKDGLIEILIAEHKGRVHAASLLVFYDQMAFYHHSGSTNEYGDEHAQYALQWALIKRAKERGAKTYDFWGVAPTDNPNHPRAGLTFFKKGFGGKRVRWMNTLDYPIKVWKYWPMWIYVKLERLKKGL